MLQHDHEETETLYREGKTRQSLDTDGHQPSGSINGKAFLVGFSRTLLRGISHTVVFGVFN